MKINILTCLFFCTVSYAGSDNIFNNGFEQPTCNNETVFEEQFLQNNISGWGGLWEESGTQVDVIQAIGGQGRLIPVASGYSLARVYYPLNLSDVDITFSFVFENGATQGIGFYVRGNGGYLQQTNPTGQGYAVFLERFSGQPRLGLWYENNGQEIPFTRDPNPNYELFDDISYQVRFQAYQENANTTRLRAKVCNLVLLSRPSGMSV